MADQFARFSDSPTAPARKMFLITPHNTNAIDPIPKAVRFDGSGAVVLRAVGSAADVTLAVSAGEVIDVRVQYVRATGTTATPIHGLA